jgi:hypothetical protein
MGRWQCLLLHAVRKPSGLQAGPTSAAVLSWARSRAASFWAQGVATKKVTSRASLLSPPHSTQQRQHAVLVTLHRQGSHTLPPSSNTPM